MNSLKPILDFYMERGGAAAWEQEHHLRVDEDGDAVKWCPFGAAHFCYVDPRLFLEALFQLNARVRAVSNVEFTVIFPWNDCPGRTWEDVEALLSMDDVL